MSENWVNFDIAAARAVVKYGRIDEGNSAAQLFPMWLGLACDAIEELKADNIRIYNSLPEERGRLWELRAWCMKRHAKLTEAIEYWGNSGSIASHGERDGFQKVIDRIGSLLPAERAEDLV